LARLIAQKIAYQWFSSPSWWSYAWMTEGIATIFGTDAINKVIFLNYFSVYIDKRNVYIDIILNNK